MSRGLSDTSTLLILCVTTLLFSGSCTEQVESQVTSGSMATSPLQPTIVELEQAPISTTISEIPVPTFTPADTPTPLPLITYTPVPSDYSALDLSRTLYDEIIQPLWLEWSPDGKYIAVTMGDGLLLLEGSDLSIIASYESDATEPSFVQLPAFSEEGSYLAASDGKKVIVLDGRTGEVLFEKEDRTAYALQFINDQDLIIGYIPYTILETITHRMGVGTISSRTYHTWDAEIRGPYIFADQGETLIYWGIYDIYVLEGGRYPPARSLPWGILLETALDEHVIMADARQCALKIYQLDDEQSLGEFSWCDAEGGGSWIRNSVGLTLLATEFEIDLDRDLVALGHENGDVTVWRLSTAELIGRTSLPLFSHVRELRFNPVIPELAILASDQTASMKDRIQRDLLTILEFDIE